MMAKATSRKTCNRRKSASLQDLDQAKSAALNSLSSADAQRGYRHVIDELVEWYCSGPRLSFNLTVVIGYRMHLEQRKLAPGTIDSRLGSFAGSRRQEKVSREANADKVVWHAVRRCAGEECVQRVETRVTRSRT
jgi:hypothetical protein